MKPFYDLLKDILDNGNDAGDRTGTGTRSVFGRQLRFDLNEGFPLLTGKFTPFKLVTNELLWFLSGSVNNEDLRKLNGNDRATIWEEWADENGSLGPMYSEQWRCWFNQSGEKLTEIDQIANLIEGLRKRPNSRRHVVSAWNVRDLPDESVSPQCNVHRGQMAIAPCHYSFQMDAQEMTVGERIEIYERMLGRVDSFMSRQRADSHHSYMDNFGVPRFKLSCLVNIRSSDTFLGLPFNTASYALLTHMIAQVVNMSVGELIVSIGNAHIYKNHIEQVNELLSRDLAAFPLPTLKLNDKIDSIDDFKMCDIDIIGYQSHPAIKAPVSV